MPKRIYRLLVTVKITSMHLSYWLNYLFGIPGMGYDLIANVAFEVIDATGVLAVFFNQSTGSLHGAKSHRSSFLQPVLVALQEHSLLVRF